MVGRVEYMLYAMRTCRVPDYFPMDFFDYQWQQAVKLNCVDKLVVLLQDFYTRFTVAQLFSKSGSCDTRHFLTSVLLVHMQYRRFGRVER